MRIVYSTFFLFTSLVTSISAKSSADAATPSACQDLIQASDMDTFLNEAFGSENLVSNDDDEPLRNAMKAQGLSDRSIDENLKALKAYADIARALKGPLMQRVRDDLIHRLQTQLTRAEVQELIQIFNRPVMKKFRTFSAQNMPVVVKKIFEEKEKNLTKPLEDLQKKLVVSPATETSTRA